MTTVAFVSQNGGVGTTTSALATASGLAREGHKTLLVDLNLLGNCALGLGLESSSNVNKWLMGDEPASSYTIITHAHGLRLLSCDSRIREVNWHYIRFTNDWSQLVTKIRSAAPDSWVIIDSPKGNLLGEAVIAAADMVIIPFRGDNFSWHGVLITMQLIEAINPIVKVILLPTLMDLRQRVAQHYMSEAHRTFGGKVALPIPLRSAVAEASAYGKTIWDFTAAGIEEVKAGYKALIARLLTEGDTSSEANDLLGLQQQVADLKRQLEEANTWRSRHEIHGRMDTLEVG